MVKPLKVCWQSWNGESTEYLSLDTSEDDLVATGTIVNTGADGFVARYRIICDASWATRNLSLEVEQDGKKRRLDLESDGNGTWASSSQSASCLYGAIDVDLSITPFTNTLPIRRLKLKENQTQEIHVVYIMVPSLDFSLKRQRYTCIVPNERYLFEQPSDDFKQEILVDENGLVKIYPELFKKVNC